MSKIFITLLVLVVAGFAFIYWQNSQTPKLGVVDGKLSPLGSRPNCVSTQAQDPSKKVDTLKMKGSLEETKQSLLSAIDSYGGAEYVVVEDDYIYVVFVTPTMKYRDDAEFWIDVANNEVHFRSSSRAGYSDRGLNRQRYGQLMINYNAI